MLVEIDRFVNWPRRRNPEARTWRDYCYDLQQFTTTVGDRPPGLVTFHDVDRFVSQQAARDVQHILSCHATHRLRHAGQAGHHTQGC